MDSCDYLKETFNTRTEGNSKEKHNLPLAQLRCITTTQYLLVREFRAASTMMGRVGSFLFVRLVALSGEFFSSFSVVLLPPLPQYAIHLALLIDVVQPSPLADLSATREVL